MKNFLANKHMLHHRHSFFPVILAVITLALLLFVVYTVKPSSPQDQGPDPITYQEQTNKLVTQLIEDLEHAQQDTQKEQLIVQAQQTLLDVHVPSAFRQTHLALAVSFVRLKEGLLSGALAYEQALSSLNQLIDETPWLMP